MEAQLLVAALAGRFRVVPNAPGLPAPDATFTLRPLGGLPATIRDLRAEVPNGSPALRPAAASR